MELFIISKWPDLIYRVQSSHFFLFPSHSSFLFGSLLLSSSFFFFQFPFADKRKEAFYKTTDYTNIKLVWIFWDCIITLNDRIVLLGISLRHVSWMYEEIDCFKCVIWSFLMEYRCLGFYIPPWSNSSSPFHWYTVKAVRKKYKGEEF